MAGPPPPPAPTVSSSSTSNKGRSALLSSIQSGAKLKKATTSDRSAPIVAPEKTSSGKSGSSAGLGKSSSSASLGSTALFAGGIPKLKSSTGKLDTKQTTAPTNHPQSSPKKTALTNSVSSSNKSLGFNSKASQELHSTSQANPMISKPAPGNFSSKPPLPPPSVTKPPLPPPSGAKPPPINKPSLPTPNRCPPPPPSRKPDLPARRSVSTSSPSPPSSPVKSSNISKGPPPPVPGRTPTSTSSPPPNLSKHSSPNISPPKPSTEPNLSRKISTSSTSSVSVSTPVSQAKSPLNFQISLPAPRKMTSIPKSYISGAHFGTPPSLLYDPNRKSTPAVTRGAPPPVPTGRVTRSTIESPDVSYVNACISGLEGNLQTAVKSQDFEKCIKFKEQLTKCEQLKTKALAGEDISQAVKQLKISMQK